MVFRGNLQHTLRVLKRDYNNVVGLPVARLVHELKVF